MAYEEIPDYLTEYVACWPSSDQCIFCAGYCGPSFGQHVCATCHAFLFADPGGCREPFPSRSDRLSAGLSRDKPEDSDSGNDEPADLFLTGSGSSSASTPGSSGGPALVAVDPASNGVSASSRPSSVNSRVQELSAGENSAIFRQIPDPLRHRLQLLSEPAQLLPASSSCVNVQLLPAEVLLCIFEYVDDLTAWAMGNVCRRWRHLLMSQFDEHKWRSFTLQRFPLFSAEYPVKCWSFVYSKLVESACCWQCLYHSCPLYIPPPDDDRSLRRKRLLHERKLLKSDPPEGIRAAPLDPTLSRWQATITGPEGSAYEGGLFFLILQIPESYPLRPPTVRFLTRILHPNVSRHGDIGVDSVQHNWTLALSIEKVLISIQSLLTDPFCGVCMEPRLGRLCQHERAWFVRLARAWCRRYATVSQQPCVDAECASGEPPYCEDGGVIVPLSTELQNDAVANVPSLLSSDV